MPKKQISLIGFTQRNDGYDEDKEKPLYPLFSLCSLCETYQIFSFSSNTLAIL
jgi:hypothetical protein